MVVGSAINWFSSDANNLWCFLVPIDVKSFFRDLERFIGLGIMLMFYCTPILYSIDMIPDEYRWMVNYNPLATMVLCWRDLFMNGHVNYDSLVVLYGYGAAFILIGASVFNKLKFRFAEIL